MYDLVLKGGTVVDPSSGLDGALDVAVERGVIARIAPDIAPAEAARVIEVRGTVVTPGLSSWSISSMRSDRPLGPRSPAAPSPPISAGFPATPSSTRR